MFGDSFFDASNVNLDINMSGIGHSLDQIENNTNYIAGTLYDINRNQLMNMGRWTNTPGGGGGPSEAGGNIVPSLIFTAVAVVVGIVSWMVIPF